MAPCCGVDGQTLVSQACTSALRLLSSSDAHLPACPHPPACLPACLQWSSSLTPIKFVTLTDVVLTIKQGQATVGGGDQCAAADSQGLH